MKNGYYTHTNYKKSYVVGDHDAGKIVKCRNFAKSSYLKKQGIENRLEEVIKDIDRDITNYKKRIEEQNFSDMFAKEGAQKLLNDALAAKEQSKHGEIIELTPNLQVPNGENNND